MKNTEKSVKAATNKQLAEKYGIPEKTMRAWIDPIRCEVGPRIGHHYTPKQVDIIDKHVGPAILLLFGFFIKASDAKADSPQAPHADINTYDLTNDDGSILQCPGDAPTPVYYSILFAVWLLTSYYFLAFKIKTLIERFIDTPENRRLAIIRSQDKVARVRDFIKITMLIIYIMLVFIATVFAGHWVGVLYFKAH